ncbi:MAG TPA: chaperone modulator CbpM [Stellaceae bacterium]|nr:chaperone modulator CbpM [Stellaceae bacterium]
MIAFETVLREVKGLDADELERWIAVRWVKPERRGEAYLFHEIDVARIHLIVELRHELMIDDEAMPVVLQLLDQVYALRHRLNSLAQSIESLPPEIKEKLRAYFEA